MPSDVLITPASSKIEFTDGANATKTLKITGTSLNTDTSFAIGATTANNTLSVLGSASIGSGYNVAAPTNGLIVQGTVGLGTTSPLYKLDNYNDTIRYTLRCSEKTLAVTFPNGVANQKVDITFDVAPGNIVFWGNLEVEVTDGYSNQLSTGQLIKVFAVGMNAATGAGPYTQALYDNTSYYKSAYGAVADNYAIDGIFFNTTTGKYYFTLIHRTSTGNVPIIKIKGFGYDQTSSNNIVNLTAGSVYTTNTTTYYKPVVEALQSRIGYNGNINQTADLIVQGTVGIGTNNPGVLLDVQGSSGVRIANSTYEANLLFGNDQPTWGSGVRVYDSGDAEMRIWHRNTRGQIVLATGYNGNGATSLPTDGLFIVGDTTASPALKVGVGYIASNLRGGSAKFAVNGNVGVGTASPSNRVTVEADATGASFADNSVGQLVIRGATNTAKRLGLGIDTTNNVGVIQAQLYGTGQYPLALNPAGGNVGIGTVTPTQLLDVRGNIKLGADNSGNYIYYVTDIERTILRTTRSDVTQQGLFRSDGWGNFTIDNSIGIGYSLGTGFSSSTIGNGNLYVLNTVGIGTTSPLTKLEIRNGSITAGTASSTNGSTLIAGYYTAGALTILGTEQSSGGPVLGYAVTPSTSSTGAFLSATSITIPRSAYTQDGGTHRWYVGASQTVAIGSAVTTSEVMRINSSGSVGIGVISNLQPLSVGNSSANTFGLLRTGVSAVAGNTGPSINFYLSQNATTSLTGDTNLARILANPIDGWGGYLQFFTKQNDGVPGNSPVVRMTITTDGNVGINTTTPAYKLEVIGDARISGGIINPSLSAQWTLSGGGTVTYNGSAILWSNRVIAIPVEKDELSTTGYIDINCPTSGTITYYNASNVTTTATCAASGVPISAWEALYYEITPGQSYSTDQTKFRLVNYQNSTWRPSSNWLLICAVNGDASSLKWIPGQVIIPTNGSFDSSNSTNNWQIAGTTNYVAKFTSANKVGNSVLYDNGANIGVGTASPAYKLDVSGIIASGGSPIAWFSGNYNRIYEPAGNPALYLGNNSDPTNYYDNSTHYFRSRGGGTNYAIITSSGNVGIGTSNPAAKLDIVGTNTAIALSFGTTVPNNPLFINTYGGYAGVGMDQTTAGIRLAGDYSGGTNPLVDIGYYTSGSVSHANWISRLKIINNGNVGIGSTLPAYKLDVAGRISYNGAIGEGADTTLSSSGTVLLHGNSATWTEQRFYTSGTQKATINTSGNLGIGTTTVSYKLHVQGDIYARSAVTNTSADLNSLRGNVTTMGYSLTNSPSGAGWITVYTSQNFLSSGDILSQLAYDNYNQQKLFTRYSADYGATWSAWKTIINSDALSGTTNYIPKFTGTNSIGNSLIFDNGTNVAIGSNAVAYGRLQISATGTSPSLSSTNPTDVSLIISNSDIAYGTMFATYGDGKGALQQRRTNAATYYDFSLQPHGGNVGIGILNPTSLLHVGGTSTPTATATPTAIQLDNSFRNAVGGNTSLKFYLYKNSNESYGFGLNNAGGIEYHAGYSGGSASNHAFYTDTTEKVRINNAGNVGVGTTNPAQKLEINGNILLQNVGAIFAKDSGGTARTVLYGRFTDNATYLDGGTGGLYIRTNDANTTAAFINASGNVGVGTTNPINKFAVISSNSYGYYNRTEPIAVFQGSSPSTVLIAADANSNGAYSELKLGNAQSTYYTYSAYIRGIQGAGIDYYRLEFGTANGSTATTKMTIATDGNVGIGTITPSLSSGKGLHIYSNSGHTNLKLDNAGRIWELLATTGGYFSIYDTTGGADRLSIASSGNVGIGNTSPNNKLHVNGSMSIGSSYNTAGPTDGLIVQGNVGIGMTTTNYKLNVSTSAAQGFTLTTNNSTVGGPQIDLYDATRQEETVISSTDSVTVGTYIASYSNHPLLFGTYAASSSTAKMAITVSGNVGIGTKTPTAKLHVNSTTSGDTLLRADGTNGTLFSVVDDLSDSLMSVNNSAGLPVLEVFADDRVIAGQYGANDLVVRNNKVGVGTSNPNNKLHIYNSSGGSTIASNAIAVFEQSSNAGIQVCVPDASEAGLFFSRIGAAYYSAITRNGTDLLLKNNSATAVTINSSGNVGINTANPTTKLYITGSVTVLDGTFISNVTSGADKYFLNCYGTSANQMFSLYENSSNVYLNSYTTMALRANQNGGSGGFITLTGGNVGVGGNPSARLHVIDTNQSPATGNLLVSSTGGNASIRIDSNASTNYTYLTLSQGGTGKFELGIVPTSSDLYINPTVQSGANGAAIYVKKADGNVGINSTSPNSPLTVYNNSDVWHFRLGGASGELRMGGQTNSGAVIQAYTPGGSVRDLYLQRDGGNIGISTNSPTAKLHMVATGGDGTPALRIVGSASDTFNWASSTMYANLVAAETAIHLIGKAQSQYNSAYLGYRHVADGSSSNMLSLGLYSADHLVNILGNGNVGIGTTGPATKLDVFGPISIRGTKVLSTGFDDFGGLAYDIYANIRVLRSTSAQGDGMYIGYGGSGGPLRFFSNSGATEFMTIATSGNIGINSTSPSSKFVVNNNGGTGSAFYVDVGNRNDVTTLFEHTGSTTPVPFRLKKSGYSGSASNYGLLYLHMNDNTVGNGSNLYFTLNDSAGNEHEYAGIGANVLVNTNGSESGDLLFYTSDAGTIRSEKVRVKFNGRVGIGTTAPATLLQIGTGTPTSATGGLQFGDDTATRLYRSTSGVIFASSSFRTNDAVLAGTYLQTLGNLIYPNTYGSTLTLQVSNSANNAWIAGVSIAPGGNVTVAGTLTESSSIRYKENIETISAPILPKLNKIRPVTYNKKDNPKHIEYGIIAEELNELFPEFVNKNESGEVESVNYSRLTVILIKAVKELQEEVEKLKNK